uniref:Putative lipoprotein n=1 Tax=Caulobacter sp. (strain K31) TaxID=366602 RepID=B0T3U2_CAUSK
MFRDFRWAVVGALLSLTAASQALATPDLAYQLTEGQNLNAFVREDTVAAHLLLRNGDDPRILVAFPAGNSGVGLWFERTVRPATWRLDQSPRPVRRGAFNGVIARASLDAPRLVAKQAVLSNVRYLRDYQAVGRFPAEVAAEPTIEGDTITWRRARLDGGPGYQVMLRVIDGRIEQGAIVAGSDGRIALEITALTGDAPLTPLPIAQLLNAEAAADPAARNALAFLSYREKFLAGSWRFNTYFGRDTLMSVRLLMPALRPAAVEAGLNSVLARLSPGGEVAHEEGVGEFAIVQNRQSGHGGDAAELDYGMIDDDYMLGAVAADYLQGPGQARARTYLAQPLASERQPGVRTPIGAALAANLRFVLRQSRGFADAPSAGALIAIKPGRTTGEWRDSNDGLGGGVYPYDVNAVLVPAAIEAADCLFRAGLLDPYLSADDRVLFADASRMARVWRAKAPPLFRVELPAGEAAAMVHAYADDLGVPAAPAVRALDQRTLVFHALSLEATGKPVPIMNSDEGFALLFGQPSAADLDTYVKAITRPFPAGLMTDVGLVVANAAFGGPELRTRFTPAAYHGAVIWSWHQALLAAGIERQLARRDLPAATRQGLTRAQATLWRAITATRGVQSSELWSWAFRDGRYVVAPFGAGKADVDESNAAQLWSTVYLAVRPPPMQARARARAIAAGQAAGVN